ncbi:putative bifunctional diguanylate cyclase/phosphodiesterase [Antarcticirhabdus aurantiaca]|uniref:EAL domain-containing protein n=1 Tax=Antarcticirhabdus aurantiaca TaxID=2606717 RepID=A0ACD4NU19_9HYPH|nr:EAL domain-containing protein [Antarcticirhabdus aurantiaca]WAJ30287.1 EAL domain-containing protein [Jeongeuplla avenae]
MSLQLKLLAGGVIFALATILFAAFSHGTLVESRALSSDLYERGMHSLNRLQEAQRYASVLSDRYQRILSEVGGSTPAYSLGSAESLDVPMSDISAMLKEAADGTASPEVTKRIGDLLYPLSRLAASQGEVSLRLASRELARIASNLDVIVSEVRAEVTQTREQADRQFNGAATQTWIGLAIVVALGLAATGIMSWRVGRLVGDLRRQARRIARGDILHPIKRNDEREFAEVFDAIEVLQASCASLQERIGRQATTFDERLQNHENRFLAALNNMPQGLCMLDGGFNLLVYNDPFAAMFPNLKPGMSAREILGDKRFHTVLEPDATGEFVKEMPDGEVMRIKRRGMRDKGLLVTFENITAQHHASQRMEHLAGHDGLTELANRRRFCERLDEILALRGSAAQDIAVITLDVNDFKSVNDTFGHPVGDALLKAVGDRLRAVTGRRDVVARLGGDEFAVIQVGARQPEGGERLAAQIVAAMGEPFEINNRHIHSGVSLGAVPVPRRMVGTMGDADHVMQNCDLALYRAKAEGRSGYRIFEPSMREALNERRELERDLRLALENDELEIFYQPFVHADRQAVSGFEALLRWRHPRRGLVSPGVFIPLAEEIGLIEQIGVWALRTASAQAANWPGDLILSVNLSPVQFRSRTLVADVRQALARSGLSPRRLQLEVTESLFLDDGDNTLAILTDLRSDGMIISMDDFGTGYSSLGYLSRFPFDKIKIDQSFVRDMTLPENMAIVRAVIGLGRALKMPVIAEGIETVEQLRMLRAEGCREMQGFLFSRPRPAGDLPRILAEVQAFWASEREAAHSVARVAESG